MGAILRKLWKRIISILNFFLIFSFIEVYLILKRVLLNINIHISKSLHICIHSVYHHDNNPYIVKVINMSIASKRFLLSLCFVCVCGKNT